MAHCDIKLTVLLGAFLAKLNVRIFSFNVLKVLQFCNFILHLLIKKVRMVKYNILYLRLIVRILALYYNSNVVFFLTNFNIWKTSHDG